jgi:hypothetical protein
LLALAGLFACGGNDNSGIRPVEVLFSIEGSTGTHLRIERIQAANADHCFVYPGDEMHCQPSNIPPRSQDFFEAPLLIVLENAFQFPDVSQPVRGTFGVLPKEVDPNADTIRARLFLGTDQQQSREIPPGACLTIPGDLSQPLGQYCCTGDACFCNETGSPCPDALAITPTMAPTPVVTSPEVRFELCEAVGAGIQCKDGTPVGPTNIGFSISVGDFNATNLSACSLTPTPTEPCTTPALVYLEGASERVQGVFSNLGGPGTNLQADLYVNNEFRATDTDSHNVIIDENL